MIADFDGSGRYGILATSPWGIAILKLHADKLIALATAANGTRLGDWLLDSNANVFGPAADFDGDGESEFLVTSSWGLGVVKYSDGSSTSTSMVANGTSMNGWKLDTGVDAFGATADFNQDGNDEIIVTSPWGMSVLGLATSATATSFGAIQNGADLGAWKLNTSDNVFGQAGNYSGGVVGSGGIGRPELFVSSPWGVGILVPGAGMASLVVVPNGPLLGGWNLQTSANVLGPTAKYDGEPQQDQILVTSSRGIGVLTLNRTTDNVNEPVTYELTSTTAVPTGPVGAWNLDTTVDNIGNVGNYSPTRGQLGALQAGVFVTSPWGVGILNLSGSGVSSPMLQPNGTRFGDWLLDTSSDEF